MQVQLQQQSQSQEVITESWLNNLDYLSDELALRGFGVSMVHFCTYWAACCTHTS